MGFNFSVIFAVIFCEYLNFELLFFPFIWNEQSRYWHWCRSTISWNCITECGKSGGTYSYLLQFDYDIIHVLGSVQVQ